MDFQHVPSRLYSGSGIPFGMDTRPRAIVGSDPTQVDIVRPDRYRTPSLSIRLAMAAGAKSSEEPLMLRASILLAQLFHCKPGPSNTSLGEARRLEPAVIKDLFAVKNAKTDPIARAVKLLDATLTNIAQLESLWTEIQAAAAVTDRPTAIADAPESIAPSTLVKIPHGDGQRRCRKRCRPPTTSTLRNSSSLLFSMGAASCDFTSPSET
jgi:hypothetical protein